MSKKVAMNWNSDQSDEENIKELKEVIIWLLKIIKDDADSR
jgi:hypothetical protein